MPLTWANTRPRCAGRMPNYGALTSAYNAAFAIANCMITACNLVLAMILMPLIVIVWAQLVAFVPRPDRYLHSRKDWTRKRKTAAAPGERRGTAPRAGCASLCSPRGPATVPRSGRLAQRESASFTPRRSLVRSQYRPPALAQIRGSYTGLIPRRGWGLFLSGRNLGDHLLPASPCCHTIRGCRRARCSRAGHVPGGRRRSPPGETD